VPYDFRFLNDVTLATGARTAQLDHVVVDRYGILIIESKVRNNALILGRDVEKRWTACYRDGKKKPFQNPIDQNREHENFTRQVLRKGGAKVDADDIESIVVFVGADLKRLDLKSDQRARVVDVGSLEYYFISRKARALSRVPWTSEQINHWMFQLILLDKSSDAETLRKHAEYRGGWISPVVAAAAAPAQRLQVPAAQLGAAGGSAPSRAASAGEPARATQVEWRPTRQTSSELRGCTNYLIRVALMLAVFAIFWACMSSGLYSLAIRALLAPLLVPRATPAQSAPAITPRAASTLPQQRLRELAPDIYNAATDLDTPRVTQSGDETTYTWHYLVKTTPSTAVVRSFSIVLGPDGTMRRMGASK
jgi:hypothetical protein